MKNFAKSVKTLPCNVQISHDQKLDEFVETEPLVLRRSLDHSPELSQLRRLFVVILCFSTLILEGVNLSLPGPFFPKEGKRKGLSQTRIGLVVGSFDFANLCFSFVVASLVSPKNIKCFFIGGTLLSAITVSIFGLLEEAPCGDIFFYAGLITRLMNGVGAAMLYCTAMPIAVQMYPEKAGIITTIVLMCLGCGLCLGPPIGSLILPLGGYKCPFLMVGITELIVFLFSVTIVPNNNTETKTKIRPSDYIRFLGRVSTLSVVIPAATIFCLPGIRDTAYALYFETVLGTDASKIGFVFLANSISLFLSGFLIGLLVEMGFGALVGLFSQLFTPLMAFAFFLPMLVPQLEHVAWGVMILACNAFSVASIMNPASLVLEKIAIRQGFTNMQQVKTITASSYNLVMSSGRTFGAFVIGGYINDVMGFYYMCLSYTILLTLTAIWNVSFLIRNGFARRLFYDANLDVEVREKQPKIVTRRDHFVNCEERE